MLFPAMVPAMDMLENLFGSPVRAKLLKLFLMNPDARFTVQEASRQTQVRPLLFRHEVRRLVKLRLVKSASTRIARPLAASRGRMKFSTRRETVFMANPDFPLFAELRALCLKSAPHAKGLLAGKIKRLGTIKLAILAGVFIDNPTSRVDLLLVGEGMKKARMKSFIQWLEARVGKELNYVAMSQQEFKYRRDMYDRFVRDVLEFPHETVINKLGV